MKVLVTGADGFVGRFTVPALEQAGHEVTQAARRSGGRPRSLDGTGLRPRPADSVQAVSGKTVEFELDDADSVKAAVHADRWDAVLHLAAMASVADSLADPGAAWEVNAAGTARLAEALGRRHKAGDIATRLVIVSTAEVYDAREATPLTESAPIAPRSPYAASKRGAELAVQETAARTGLPAIIARAFPATGPGQSDAFVAPAFARRLRAAKQSGERAVRVGNLAPVRDLLDVRDVAAAYVALLERGTPGETYNVASGTGVSLEELFRRIASLVGVDAVPEADPALLRPVDVPYLVGDATKLRKATGWQPAIPLDTTLRDVVDAQAD